MSLRSRAEGIALRIVIAGLRVNIVTALVVGNVVYAIRKRIVRALV